MQNSVSTLMEIESKLLYKHKKHMPFSLKLKHLNSSRILDNPDDTIKLAEEFEATGISAIGVHGRKKHERPHHQNNTGKLNQSLYMKIIAISIIRLKPKLLNRSRANERTLSLFVDNCDQESPIEKNKMLI